MALSKKAHPPVVSLQLFPEIDLEPAREVQDTAKITFQDPAFASNKSLPIHRWVPWIAGFSSEFVKNALQNYAPQCGTILDPFAGVGTTLIEGVLNGYDAVGFEINPYAALVARIKAHAHKISVERLHHEIEHCQDFCNAMLKRNTAPQSIAPRGFKTRDAFYSPLVLRKVLILHDFMDTIADATIKDIFRVAFAATMVRYSNYSYEPSLGRRVSSGKEHILDFPVVPTVIQKLEEMAEDIRWLQSRDQPWNTTAHVIHDSFFRYSHYIERNSIDMVITSPPYLNNYHYNRNTRPQMYWLNYAEQPADLRDIEENNFGKYWQTVREREEIPLNFQLAESDLSERLHEIRGKHPEKGIYGGNGWANYAATYFNDCSRFAEGLRYALKPGGTALIVIGNSILQGVSIATDQYFGEIAQASGLELVDIIIPRATRVGNSIIQSKVRVEKAADHHQLYEAVVIVRKPG